MRKVGFTYGILLVQTTPTSNYDTFIFKKTMPKLNTSHDTDATLISWTQFS